jgi:hypothetical protein
MIKYRVGESQSDRGRFRRILDRCDPSVLFIKQLVIGEQTGSVPVGSHSEKDQVEDRERNRVFAGEFLDEFLFVGIGELFKHVDWPVGNILETIGCKRNDFILSSLGQNFWSEVRDSGALEVELLEVVGEDFIDVMDIILNQMSTD